MTTINVTNDITLRILRFGEAETVFESVNYNREYLRQWLPWLDDNQNASDSLAFIQATHAQLDNELGPNTAIFLQEKFVGMCGFHPVA